MGVCTTLGSFTAAFFPLFPFREGSCGGEGGYTGTHSPAGLLMSTRAFNDSLIYRVALSCVFG